MKERDYVIINNMLLFWNSCYSQWFNSKFKDVNGTTFTNAEQFMMYHKAILFKDIETANKILKESNPRIIKQYGREVKNFNNTEWEKYRCEIVILGNYYKFTQNKNILSIMMNSENMLLVEASPYDKIWGIGLAKEDNRCLDKQKWKGLNLLGECLMQVRNIIRTSNNDAIYKLEQLLYNKRNINDR